MKQGVRPSHFRSLFAVADEGLRVTSIASTDLWAVPSEWAASAARDYMTASDYDVAPLAQRPPYRYVERKWLDAPDGPAGTLARPLDASLVVTARMSVYAAMLELRKRPYFFVMDRQEITGVVTQADLQRPAVSMIALEFVLIVEAAFVRLVEAYFGADWRALLPARRIEAAEARLAERRRYNAALSLADCLTLEDRIAVASQNSELVRALGFGSRNEFREWSERMKRLRDTLAHAGNLLEFEPAPTAAVDVVTRIRDVAERALHLLDSAEGRAPTS